MLFNSYVFWVFLAVVLGLHALLRHRQQNRMLLVASYVFYGWWDWRFLSLIVISTLVDYTASLGIARTESIRRRKALLTLSVVANLGMLGVFKYYDFFIFQLNELFTSIGLNAPLPLLNVILPVGISFYTFQTMSYTIDVYRGHTTPTDRFWDFALYVCFFPQLVAGPIERSGRLLPQVLHERPRGGNNFRDGLYFVVLGLFKKIVIADNLAPVVNTIFNNDMSQVSGTECLVAVYAFAFQIYGDFSGYSNIAQGVARWMGFDLMHNFRMPYFAESPSDFWSRWHISLSTWLRDYLYIPLGGNRGGTLFTYRNLMLTMLLGGLWHGANWTFLAWGAFHGLILCAYRPFRGGRDAPPTRWLLRLIKIVIMFHLVCFSWLLFRAETITQALDMGRLMVTDFCVTPMAVAGLGMILFFVGPLIAFEIWLHRADDLMKLTKVHWSWRSLVYSYCVLMMIFFPPPVANVFIYFRF